MRECSDTKAISLKLILQQSPFPYIYEDIYILFIYPTAMHNHEQRVRQHTEQLAVKAVLKVKSRGFKPMNFPSQAQQPNPLSHTALPGHCIFHTLLPI